MTIFSNGYVPNKDNSRNSESQFQLFCDHLALILQHERDILSCADYFFCPLDFAFCSWPYVSGDGPLYLGYLLLGWRDRSLTADCAECGGTVLVTMFGGSVLSGSNSWAGICESCHAKQNGHWEQFGRHVQFVITLRKRFPAEVCRWEEYDGVVFSWADNGLQPARKKRLIHRQFAKPVSLNVLIDELKSGNGSGRGSVRRGSRVRLLNLAYLARYPGNGKTKWHNGQVLQSRSDAVHLATPCIQH